MQSWVRDCKAHIVSMLTKLIGADHGFVVKLANRALITRKKFRLWRFRFWGGACGGLLPHRPWNTPWVTLTADRALEAREKEG